MEKSKFNKQKLEAYCKSLGIFAVSYYTLLNNLIDSDKIAFINYYNNYQFSLSLKDKLIIQGKIKDKKNLPLMIKYNFLDPNIKSLRHLFIELCKIIINTNVNKKNCIDSLKAKIMKKNVFIENSIEFFIPVIFGNIELKFNKLIIEHFSFFLKIKWIH